MNIETYAAGNLTVTTPLPTVACLSAEIGSRLYASNVTHTFSNLTAYNKGDYVIYDGNLYKCINNHAGEWSNTDFSQTLLLDDNVQITIDDADYSFTVKDANDYIIWDNRNGSLDNVSYDSSIIAKNNTIQYLELNAAKFDAGLVMLEFPETYYSKAAKFSFDISCSNDISSNKTITLDVNKNSFISKTNTMPISDMLTVTAGNMFRLTFTGTAFKVNDKPTYIVDRINFSQLD